MKRVKPDLHRIVAVLLTVLSIICTLKGTGIYVSADNDTYGDDAYYYMDQLQSNYPSRMSDKNLAAAGEWLKSQIYTMGYSPVVQPATGQDQYGTECYGENIIFEKQGNGITDKVVVIGAHYDTWDTNGCDDNASGVGLLLETANRLVDVELNYNIRFILFSIEEMGCLGSQYYVNNLAPEELAKIACMVNLDTLGAGDNMYIYGGGYTNSGEIGRTWLVEQTLSLAQSLNIDVSFHPDVNEEYPVPIKNTASDQEAFDKAGIPYLYFEASNWNGGDHNNFYQTDNPAVENGKMMHIPKYDNLSFYTETFGNRIYEHLKNYSVLLDRLLRTIVFNSAVPEYTFEACDEMVVANADVRVRSQGSTNSDVMGVLKAGDKVRRTGYNAEWSQVEYESNGTALTCYVKTDYLEPAGLVEDEVEEETTEEVVTTTTEPEKTTAVVTTTAAPVTEKKTYESSIVITSVANSTQVAAADNFMTWVQSQGNLVMYVLIGAIALIALAACIGVYSHQKHKNSSWEDSADDSEDSDFTEGKDTYLDDFQNDDFASDEKKEDSHLESLEWEDPSWEKLDRLDEIDEFEIDEPEELPDDFSGQFDDSK